MRRLFIANRGEVAVRIIRAARDMGIDTVVGYSSGDRHSLPTKLANDAICIGGPHASASYLNMDAILSAASGTGCDSVHPGYGFLAESAAFAERCLEQGLIFVGPTPDVIERMGDKSQAREAAKSAGVPVLPGSGALTDPDTDVASSLGYPLLLKAVAGGGGRGIRILQSADKLQQTFELARREAEAAFGDGRLYMERYLERARHIEVQVLGDPSGQVVHLGERECSLQRRHQKVLEETPAWIPHGVRQQLCQNAVTLAAHVGYTGAGTVEFLYDIATHEFWFIEMNARLQVEHPITEMRCGVDLVKAQLAIASGDGLAWGQDEITPYGHAIEFRITCESLGQDFAPSPGTIEEWKLPQLPNTRVDTHCFSGYVVPPFYDSLLAKLVVFGDDRAAAVARLRHAVENFTVSGVPTNLDLLALLLEMEEFHKGDFHTRWLEPAIIRALDRN